MVRNNFYLISLFVILIDQFSKFIAEQYLLLNQTVPVIKNMFHLTLIHNQGAGFGILQGFNWPLFWLGVVIMGFILFYWDKIKTNAEKVIMAVISGGILGNMIDRAFFGYTIDFLDLQIWPVFNVADSAMTLGVIALIYLIWKK